MLTFELSQARRNLIAMRDRYRGNLPLTSRINGQIEMMRELETADGDRRDNIMASARQNLAEIAQIQRDGFYANPLDRLRLRLQQ